MHQGIDFLLHSELHNSCVSLVLAPGSATAPTITAREVRTSEVSDPTHCDNLNPQDCSLPGKRVEIYHVRHCGVAASAAAVTGISTTVASVSPRCFSMCGGVLLDALCVTVPRPSIWHTSRWLAVAAVTEVRMRFIT
jgi:hypothetical protein